MANNELQKLVKEIQYQTDESLETIATRLGYTRSYFTDQVNKGGNSSVMKRLLKHYGGKIKHLVRNPSQSNDMATLHEDSATYERPTDLMKLIVELMKKQNLILDRQTKNVEEKIEQIDTNLTGTLGQIDSLKLDLVTGRLVVLQSLSRLEGKKEDHLVKLADNIKLKLLDEQKQHGKSAGTGR